MENNHIRSLLKRYLENECTEEERLFIDKWLDKNSLSGDEWSGGEVTDEKLKAIKIKIDRHIDRRRVGFGYVLKIAAIFLLISASAVAVWYYSSSGDQNTPVVAKTVHKETRNGWVELSTPKGLTYTFDLPDGSSVVMNASSKIRYPALSEPQRRSVYLDEGEAYFSVAKDRTKPFTVYTPRFATTALGTVFNIRSYQKEHIVSVSLIHGKVRVDDLRAREGTRKTSFLSPHQQIVLNTSSDKMESKRFEKPVMVTGWSQGLLTFDNASVDEVITSIENRFDVTIRYLSARTDWKYTGSFKDETLEEVLQTICLTEGVSYKMLSRDSVQIN